MAWQKMSPFGVSDTHGTGYDEGLAHRHADYDSFYPPAENLQDTILFAAPSHLGGPRMGRDLYLF